MVLETKISIFASTMVVLGFQVMELVVHEDVQLVVPIQPFVLFGKQMMQAYVLLLEDVVVLK